MNHFKQRSIAIILTLAVALSMCFTPISAQAYSNENSTTENVISKNLRASAVPVTSLSAKTTAYNKIRLSWNDWSSENEGYNIYRATSKSGPYKKVKQVKEWGDSWTDAHVKTGTRYYYKIQSFKTELEEYTDESGILQYREDLVYSSFSKVVSAVAKLKKPSLTAKSAGKTKVKLSWKKVSGASGYKIYKYNSKKKKYTAVKTIKKGSKGSWVNKKLPTKKKARYKIKAYRNVDGHKVYSVFSKGKSAIPKAKAKKKSSHSSTVYITRTGSKFHRGSCRYLSRSKIPISRSNTITQGYEACKVCRP